MERARVRTDERVAGLGELGVCASGISMSSCSSRLLVLLAVAAATLWGPEFEQELLSSSDNVGLSEPARVFSGFE